MYLNLSSRFHLNDPIEEGGKSLFGVVLTFNFGLNFEIKLDRNFETLFKTKFETLLSYILLQKAKQI